jgi:hypothetical protein
MVDDVVVAESLRLLVTSEVARELASTFGDQVVFPDRIVIDRPGAPDRRFPGWPTSVLLLLVENQGVCAWGVPLDDPDPPVLVGGDLAAGVDETTVRHAGSVEGFVAARRWDHECLNQELVIQAQAATLDRQSLELVRGWYEEQPSTTGWPGAVQYRFERDGLRILLWSSPDQCDWWISSARPEQLPEAVEQLMSLSDLRTSLWSNEPSGEVLLDQIRGK